MSGATRSSSQGTSSESGAVDRDTTIESLLLTGLDCYFAGEYDRAIHAWTRVLFLDRSHPRARAYFERARAVHADRQRLTDELVHGGLAAYDDGDASRARSLLAQGPLQKGLTACVTSLFSKTKNPPKEACLTPMR